MNQNKNIDRSTAATNHSLDESVVQGYSSSGAYHGLRPPCSVHLVRGAGILDITLPAPGNPELELVPDLHTPLALLGCSPDLHLH